MPDRLPKRAAPTQGDERAAKPSGVPPGLTEESIRSALARILSSRAFHHSDRLKRFLSFASEQTLRGQADAVKEYVIGVQVFGRKDFDPRIDAVVRVEAGRLRSRLQRYYETEGRRDEVVIELPKGSYAAMFRPGAGPPHDGEARRAAQKRIAVLPFADRSSTRDQGYFCDGMTEALIEALTKVEGLRVSAWPPSAGGRGKAGLAAEIGKLLQADWAVEGWLHREGRLVKAAVRLVDVAENCILWSGSFERRLQEVFELQEEMAREIVRTLKLHSAGESEWLAARRPTTSSDAYRLYLKGRYHWNKRTQEGLYESILQFERALVRDNRYALALAGLADSYSLLGNYGVLPSSAVRDKARQAAFGAVEIDPELTEARASKAHILATYEWNWAAAESEYEHAIRLRPWYATAHHWYAVTCLMPQRRLDEALVEIQEAQELDPVSSSIGRDAAVVYYARREYDRAIQQARKLIEMDPIFPEGYWILGVALEGKGQFTEAIAAMQKCASRSRTPRILGALGHACAAAGLRAEAEANIHELEALSARRYVSPFDTGVIHLGLNDPERTVEWLERAYQSRCYELVWLRIDPRFDGLRSNAAFDTILDRIGLYGPDRIRHAEGLAPG